MLGEIETIFGLKIAGFTFEYFNIVTLVWLSSRVGIFWLQIKLLSCIILFFGEVLLLIIWTCDVLWFDRFLGSLWTCNVITTYSLVSAIISWIIKVFLTLTAEKWFLLIICIIGFIAKVKSWLYCKVTFFATRIPGPVHTNGFAIFSLEIATGTNQNVIFIKDTGTRSFEYFFADVSCLIIITNIIRYLFWRFFSVGNVFQSCEVCLEVLAVFCFKLTGFTLVSPFANGFSNVLVSFASFVFN